MSETLDEVISWSAPYLGVPGWVFAVMTFEGDREARFEEPDFEWATLKLQEIAGEFAAGRLISTLEGGYDLEALGNSVQAHAGALAASV